MFGYRHIDMKHEFLAQVRKNWRKTLCVIVGVARTTKDASIHMKTDVKAEEKLDAEGVSFIPVQNLKTRFNGHNKN